MCHPYLVVHSASSAAAREAAAAAEGTLGDDDGMDGVDDNGGVGPDNGEDGALLAPAAATVPARGAQSGAAAAQGLDADLCSVCLDGLEDPVVALCGHAL